MFEYRAILSSKRILNNLMLSITVDDTVFGKKIRIKAGKLLAISRIFRGDIINLIIFGQEINRNKNSIRNQTIIVISIFVNTSAIILTSLPLPSLLFSNEGFSSKLMVGSVLTTFSRKKKVF